MKQTFEMFFKQKYINLLPFSFQYQDYHLHQYIAAPLVQYLFPYIDMIRWIWLHINHWGFLHYGPTSCFSLPCGFILPIADSVWLVEDLNMVHIWLLSSLSEWSGGEKRMDPFCVKTCTFYNLAIFRYCNGTSSSTNFMNNTLLLSSCLTTSFFHTVSFFCVLL